MPGTRRSNAFANNARGVRQRFIARFEKAGRLATRAIRHKLVPSLALPLSCLLLSRARRLNYKANVEMKAAQGRTTRRRRQRIKREKQSKTHPMRSLASKLFFVARCSSPNSGYCKASAASTSTIRTFDRAMPTTDEHGNKARETSFHEPR